MGTALYYEFLGDDDLFFVVMDDLCRAIGDPRMPAQLPEAVPPARAPAPAPAPAPTPTPAPAPAAALVPAATPTRSFTPSLGSSQLQSSDAMVLVERLIEEAKLEKAEMHLAMEQLRKEVAPQEAITGQQLSALQARLEAVHAAKLLTDEEFFSLEDLCADGGELRSAVETMSKVTMLSTPAFEPVAKLFKLVCLSEQMQSDAAFARQARRKFRVFR